MEVRLRPLTRADAPAHCAGEDDATVRWFSGCRGTVEGTREYFDWLADNARAGRGKRAFGVWLGDRLAGYVDYDPDLSDGLEPGDVNISYAVHPWARGRGVAAEAVRLLCDELTAQGVGTRAAIRVEPENLASVRVAEKCGFSRLPDFTSATDTNPDGTPARMRRYVCSLCT